MKIRTSSKQTETMIFINYDELWKVIKNNTTYHKNAFFNKLKKNNNNDVKESVKITTIGKKVSRCINIQFANKVMNELNVPFKSFKNPLL